MNAHSKAFPFLILLGVVFLMVLSSGCGDSDDDDDNDDTESQLPDVNGEFATRPACTEEAEAFVDGGDLVLRNCKVTLRYHLTTGSFDVRDEEDFPFILNAEARVQSHVVVPAHDWRSGDMFLSNYSLEDVTDALGEGVKISVVRGKYVEVPWIVQHFTIYDGQSAVVATVGVENFSGEVINVGAIYPLYIDAPEGALLLGDNTDLRVLTNGVFDYLDFIVPLYPGTEGTLSNWSSMLHNQVTGKSLHVGFLTIERALAIVYNAPLSKNGGQKLHADCQYEPAKHLGPGQRLESEVLAFDYGQDTPHQALTTFADRVKAWQGIRTWMERHPEIGVPAGWNSWAGGGSSGGYGTDINEEVILENMYFADRELRRWGMNYFQIDDGWAPARGDWEVWEERFPNHGEMNGIQWLLHRANELGFQTGLWIQGFHADEHSHVYQEHPDWIAEPFLGIESITDGEPLLDISHPEVQEHLRSVANRLVQWGIQWLKLDFAYRIVMTDNWYNKDQTRIELYKSGARLFQEELGEDIFFLAVSVIGPNMGVIDSCRMTLDTMPAWEGEAEDPYGPIDYLGNQGLKPMYRDSSRRYYFNGRVWVNHPDLIFFRAHRDTSIPPLTLNESQTFTTSIALQGGLVKIGDRLVDLSPEAVDSLRRILPASEITGMPLDLMEREFAEVWALDIADFDEPYHVLGLLNWGQNRDTTKLPYTFLADAGRQLGADLTEAGLDPSETYLAYEFWTQEYLGEVAGEFSMEVPARSPRVVSLRKKLDRPQLLGTNRHVVGGRGVIHSLAWDENEKTYTGVQEGAIGTEHSPFTHRVTLYAPDGFAAIDSVVTAPAGYEIEAETIAAVENLVTLEYKVIELPGTYEEGDEFPDVTWSVQFE